MGDYYSYYMYSNPDVCFTERELIKISEHKIYSFYIHWWVIYQCQSHSSIQFIVECFRKKLPKFLVSGSYYIYPWVSFSINTNQFVNYAVIYLENVGLQYTVCSHYPLWIIQSNTPEKFAPFLISESDDYQRELLLTTTVHYHIGREGLCTLET